MSSAIRNNIAFLAAKHKPGSSSPTNGGSRRNSDTENRIFKVEKKQPDEAKQNRNNNNGVSTTTMNGSSESMLKKEAVKEPPSLMNMKEKSGTKSSNDVEGSVKKRTAEENKMKLSNGDQPNATLKDKSTKAQGDQPSETQSNAPNKVQKEQPNMTQTDDQDKIENDLPNKLSDNNENKERNDAEKSLRLAERMKLQSGQQESSSAKPITTTTTASTKKKSPFAQLLDAISVECEKVGIWSEALQRDLPKKWEKHGDMVILPENSMVHPDWRKMGREIWALVGKSLKAERVGRKRRIAKDDFRSPHIELLHGRDGWVEHVDNGIRYQYDVTKNMFSIGNISEKIRIAEMDCKGETIVDMFAGIGYFTLPYLVHAGAGHVFAVDWNPDAIEALVRNVGVNGVHDKCTILTGDCRKERPVQKTPSGVADKVNMGLLPTSSPYLLTGCRALKASGGILIIHENITSAKLLNRSLPRQHSDAEPNGRKSVQRQTTLPAFSNGEQDEMNGEVIGEAEGLAMAEELRRAKSPSPEDLVAAAKKMALKSMFAPPGNLPTSRRKGSRAERTVEAFESLVAKEPRIAEPDAWDTLDEAWKAFALETGRKATQFLNNLHENAEFQATILRVGKIKSYAPHIDHIVLDLACYPTKA